MSLLTVLLFLGMHWLCMSAEDRCLKYKWESGDCVCCKSGYIGSNCNESCEHCENRELAGRCHRKCTDGYFGSHCQDKCPENCRPMNDSPGVCRRKNGQCAHGCMPRYFGENCEKKCNDGCVNSTCHITGICNHGCKVGYYGDACSQWCGKNCRYGKCTTAVDNKYRCIGGCKDGFKGPGCDLPCPKNCEICIQTTGQCKSCKAGYQLCKNWECVPDEASCFSGTSDINNKYITFTITMIMFTVFFLFVSLMYVRKWRQRRRYDLGCKHLHAEKTLLPLLSDEGINRRPVPGTVEEDVLTLYIEKEKETFFPTKGFKEAQSILEEHKHVTICGASGEGKTTMALMLADEYRKKGYHIIFVNEPNVVPINTCLSYTRLFLILDDIFDSAGLYTNIKQLRQLLITILQHIDNCRKLIRKPTVEISKFEDDQSSPDIRVVITSITYNLINNLPLLQHEKYELFSEESTVDLTANENYRYTSDDQNSIFARHRQMSNRSDETIVTRDHVMSILEYSGFPRACKIFFSLPNCSIEKKDVFVVHETPI